MSLYFSSPGAEHAECHFGEKEEEEEEEEERRFATRATRLPSERCTTMREVDSLRPAAAMAAIRARLSAAALSRDADAASTARAIP